MLSTTPRRVALRTIGAGLSIAAASAAYAAPAFPTVLSANTTGFADSIFLGAPDDTYLGLGRDSVTYDFGALVVANRPGAVDLNVYEVDFGTPEFNRMTILASQDGVSFVSLKVSETTLARIVGDSVHGANNYGRSYDLGALAWARYVRIQGTGTARAGGSTDFDLDAIGAHEMVPTPVPEPGTWALMMSGLAGMAVLARRRRAPRD
ncbi:MAG: PEP-CTERM sorting domain-containing protein [Aquabacterium sp.]